MKRLVTVGMALGMMCITVPAGHAQSLPSIGQCPPDSSERVCVDIKGNGQAKDWTLPASPSAAPPRAIGECLPGSAERVCVDIKNSGEAKAAWTFPESPLPQTAQGIGQCPRGSADRVCVDIKGNGEAKSAWRLPENGETKKALRLP